MRKRKAKVDVLAARARMILRVASQNEANPLIFGSGVSGCEEWMTEERRALVVFWSRSASCESSQYGIIAIAKEAHFESLDIDTENCRKECHWKQSEISDGWEGASEMRVLSRQ